MTSETEKQIPGTGGKDQRPHATLDLTATEIFSGGKRPEERDPQADAASTSETPGYGATASAGPAQHDTALPPPYALPPRDEPGVSGFLSHVTAGLIGASLALIVGFFLFGNLRSALPVPNDPRTDELRGQLAAATQRIATLENAAKSAQGAASGIDTRLKAATDQSGALNQEIGTRAKRLGALETQPAGTPAPSTESVQQSLEPLNARLAEMEARITSLARNQDELRATTGSAALAMAVQNLRRAVAEGRPFAGELTTLTALAHEPLEVAPLEARRESGLPSLARLQRDFDASAKAAIAASRGPGDGTVTGDLLAKARRLVRVRPTGEVAGDSPEAILARAEHKLDAGDLAAALGEAGKLSGAAADAMTPWLAEAKAKAAADETLAKLESKLMTSLSTERAKDENAKRGG